jgi:hypothetical protein
MRHTEQEEACVHEAMALLPWYVNGTLGLEERRAIEDHLATCVLCPDELIALLKVQSVLHRELAEAPEPSAALWQKVRGRIAESPVVADQTQAADVRPPGRSAWAWLSNLLGPALRPGWALAALLLIAVQAALIVSLVARGPSQRGPEYRTLTGPTISGEPSGTRVRLRVAFVEQAPERAIRIVLEEVQATIVDGPSAAGFYLIDVPLDRGLKTPPEALRALRGRPDVVRFAALSSR